MKKPEQSKKSLEEILRLLNERIGAYQDGPLKNKELEYKKDLEKRIKLNNKELEK
jgi:hypothetical protein